MTGDSLIEGASGSKRPLFRFTESPRLSADNLAVHDGFSMSFALSGPGATAEAGHLPVRGDLAHVKLAGRYFVPHYVVPMAHQVIEPATLRKSQGDAGEPIEVLVPGTGFNVLDIAGGWAWGQVGEDGFVGYLPVFALVVAKP